MIPEDTALAEIDQVDSDAMKRAKSLTALILTIFGIYENALYDVIRERKFS